MAVVVLDIDVISGLVKKNLPASLDAKLVGNQLITTFISAGELDRRAVQRELGARRKADPFDDYFGLRERLSEIVGRDVDLVVGRSMRNPYFRAAVLSSAHDVYAA